MLVCICNGISDKHIQEALLNGASSLKEVRKQLGLGNCCGQCISFAKDLVDEKIAGFQNSQAFHLAQEIRC